MNSANDGRNGVLLIGLYGIMVPPETKEMPGGHGAVEKAPDRCLARKSACSETRLGNAPRAKDQIQASLSADAQN